ncbi:hypothetical protein ABIC65_000624 [Sphingomonas trueperi]|uniref:hypothetical protein n=1 Tax=Sphingomonas trueperi TaxID=53317 RepID=UPI003397CEA4
MRIEDDAMGGFERCQRGIDSSHAYLQRSGYLHPRWRLALPQQRFDEGVAHATHAAWRGIGH